MQKILGRLRTENPILVYLGLGSATVVVLAAAVVGAVRNQQTVTTTNARSEAQGPGVSAGEPTVGVPDAVDTGAVVSKGTAPTVKRTGIAVKDLVSTEGATRIGVTATEIRWGLHAPKTFDGAPLPLADAPLKGVDIYLAAINQSKVNGRTVVKYFGDDRYTVEGAKTASNYILNDSKVFFASGTLGVDQVATVASAAHTTTPPTPYLAAGGSENLFKDINMYQIAGSYDTHLVMLADFLGKEVKKPVCIDPSSCPVNQSIYGGLKRIGVAELASKYIHGSVESFKRAVQSTPGLEWAGSVVVPKYTDTSNTHQYQSQCLELSSPPISAQIVVPATDPLTTQLMVVQCPQVGYFPKWTMSNFAHDSDTALKLMGGSWVGVRGLSGGCYYNVWSDPKYQGKCGQLKRAHDDWVKVNGEDDWNKDGQGGASGYQLTHVWLTALKNAGNDLTRERFVAALATYNSFSDLVTGPITFYNSANISHGIDLMSVYQAGPDTKWRQVSDGLVGSF